MLHGSPSWYPFKHKIYIQKSENECYVTDPPLCNEQGSELGAGITNEIIPSVTP